jgi:tRNA nucleotidyltransferase/poly(A) polymerase
MPDYIYLLENRLSADQRSALRLLREVAREAEMILFLTGDAVRDLTSGHAVRDIEVAVTGNALDLKKALKNTPVQIWGEDEALRSLYLCFSGTVRVDLVSTYRAEYPKLGHPVIYPASIQEDLRRRDFTVNAMAISLNDGSYGLLMDPLNGVADIETRTLRLVSNYGFLEEPALLIRGTRYRARLGWDFDPKTQMRYENAKAEGVIEMLSARERSRELEQIGHEDDGLKVLHALEAEGWLRVLSPQWTPARADEEKLKALHDLVVDLLMQGVHPDISAAQMQLLTARMAPKDLAALKKQMLRPGFVDEWNSLDHLAAGFAKVLLAKENQTPSASFKLFTSYDPEAVLWLGFTSKDAAVKERFNNFLKVWPEARQRIPHVLMQEMRIRPELPNYNEIVHAVFLELIDGKLNTPEEMKAFLEPYSPPAPPPQITIKRTRGKRGEAKVKDYDDEEESEEGLEGEEDLDEMGSDEDEIGLTMPIPKVDLEPDGAEEEEGEDEEEDEEESVKRGSKGGVSAKPAPGVHTAAATSAKAEKLAAKANGTGHEAAKSGKANPAGKHEPEAKGGTKPVAKPVVPKPGHVAVKASAAHAPAKPAPHAKGKDVHPVKKGAAESHAHKPGKPATKKLPPKPAAKAHAKPAPSRHAPVKAHGSHPAPARNGKAHKHTTKKPAAKKH